MGNSHSLITSFSFSKKSKSLPIDTIFNSPSPTPTWPSEEGGFASGYIDLGGLQVHQISTFNKIWSLQKGGPGNLGATFYEPSQIPDGFFMLGCYTQSNNQPLFGWTLVAKDISNGQSSNEILKKPTDYSLVWSSKSLKSSQDVHGYIWLPTAPDGYKSVGYVVTNTPEKPSVDQVRCVLSEFTDELESADWIWGQGKTSSASKFNVYSSRPRVRGIQGQGVGVNAFLVKDGDGSTDASPSIACLKNNNFSNFSSMPNVKQIEGLFQAYSPVIYFHPKENYLPSSVNWYFTNGTLLYTKGEESNPVPIENNGANLPQGRSNDGAHWLDLPIDENSKETVKKGNLQSAEAYLQIKPMLGATFTDISVWIFYPFNGPGTAKLGLIDIP